MADNEAVRKALAQRKSFILANLETVTLKKLRAMLEDDLNVEKDSLKAHKATIAEYVDKLMASQQDEAKKEDSQPSASSSDDEDEEEEEETTRKSKSKSKETKQPAPAKTARVYSKRVDKLRTLCRQATITIPPTMYVKNKTDAELEAALIALLEKNDLNEHSGAQEAAKAKQRLQLQRDLEGIDTSNIISDGRRARRAAPTNFKAVVEQDEDDEEEEEEEEAEDSESDEEEEASEGPSVAAGAEDTDEEVVDADSPPAVKVVKQQQQQPSSAKRPERAAMADVGNATNLQPMAKKQRVVDWSDDDE